MMVAIQNDCRLCKAARFAHAEKRGVSEELIQEIPTYRESKLLSPREKAAIQFAEVLAGNHKSANDELYDELRKHFTEADIVELGWRIVTFVGYGRLLHALDLDIGEKCPLSLPSAANARQSSLIAATPQHHDLRLARADE
jgi:AhpD family alkylhydroperoxidase